jgi:uncharacterized cupredoxin-like copper-binding protein
VTFGVTKEGKALHELILCDDGHQPGHYEDGMVGTIEVES